METKFQSLSSILFSKDIQHGSIVPTISPIMNNTESKIYIINIWDSDPSRVYCEDSRLDRVVGDPEGSKCN